MEEVASAFSVTPLFVKRRMKLAQVSPALMEQFRAGEISLECLMVLASVDDIARQERLWSQLPHWQRRPDMLRRFLNQDEISAVQDPVATFVTVQAYEQAGGPVRRDLFSDDDEVHLQDAALLETLATDKLQPLAAQAQAEGWAWVEVCPRMNSERYGSHGQLRPTPRQPSIEEQQELDELAQCLQKVQEALDALEEDGDPEEERRRAIHRRQVPSAIRNPPDAGRRRVGRRLAALK